MIDREKETQVLRQLTVPELAKYYEELFGRAPRVKHKTWLWKRCAWKLEEQRTGGLSKVAQARLEELIAEIDIPLPEKVGGVTGAPSSPKPTEPVQGTTLIREYKGESLSTTKVDGGWLFDGEVHSSLTAVARAATGSRWNGRLFFGLTGRGAKAS